MRFANMAFICIYVDLLMYLLYIYDTSRTRKRVAFKVVACVLSKNIKKLWYNGIHKLKK